MDNMMCTPALGISEDELCRVKEALVDVAEALKDAVYAIAESIKKLADRLCIIIRRLFEKALGCFVNKRVVYLAFHAKKERVRKKNRKRIAKELLQLVPSYCEMDDHNE